MRRSVLGLGLVAWLVVVVAPSSAHAIVRAQSEYPYDQVWNAVVRLVRVDLGFEVTERDAEGGFILFKYRGDTGTFNASVEIVRAATDGKVGVVVQIPEMPRYTELWLVDRLTRKLRDEYGAPPIRIRRAPPAPPPASPPARDGRDGNDASRSRGTTAAGASAAARPRRNDNDSSR